MFYFLWERERPGKKNISRAPKFANPALLKRVVQCYWTTKGSFVSNAGAVRIILTLCILNMLLYFLWERVGPGKKKMSRALKWANPILLKRVVQCYWTTKGSSVSNVRIDVTEERNSNDLEWTRDCECIN